MRNRFDLLGKQIGEEALGFSGSTIVQAEIAPNAQYADLLHEPDPARAAERARLGLLGRIASSLCLIELYSDAPSGAELRACLAKHIGFWHTRAARKPPQPGASLIEPSLWIIAARTPAFVAELGLTPASGWPPGVHFFGGNVLRVRLVAAGELPHDRSTLLVRLMAGGPLLTHAIADLRQLPADAYERAVAERILLSLQHALEEKPIRTTDEEEFIVTMYSTWEDARRQGEKQGQRQERARAVLTALRVRGIPVPEAARERILAEMDPGRLERWLERAIVEASLAAVLDEPG